MINVIVIGSGAYVSGKNTMPVPLRREIIFIENKPSFKTDSSDAKRTGPAGPALSNETFSPTPAIICCPPEM